MEITDRKIWLEERFEENRPRLRLLALRMLGTLAEADDAVQESWLRVMRPGPRTLENFEGWLTTVTSRVCIDMLRTRTTRRGTLVGLEVNGLAHGLATVDPEREALLAEEIGSALLIVLEKLSPAERVSYVLHDMFDVPFGEVAALVGRSEIAARQLASRARCRVRGVPSSPNADAAKEREIVRAFLAASREGDLQALLELLNPDVVFRADKAGVRLGAKEEVRGSAVVAEGAKDGVRRTEAALFALVNGRPGRVAMAGGKPLGVFTFRIENGKISEINLIADPDVIDGLDLVVFAE